MTGFITPLLTFAGYRASKRFGRGCKPRPALVGAANPGRNKKSFAVVRSSLVHARISLAQRTYSQSLARKSFAVVRITLVHARKSLAERIGLPSLARKSFAVVRITRVHTRISLAERIDLLSLARKSFALVSISLHGIRKS